MHASARDSTAKHVYTVSYSNEQERRFKATAPININLKGVHHHKPTHKLLWMHACWAHKFAL